MYLRGLNPRTVIQEVVAAVAMGMEVIRERPLMEKPTHRQEFRVRREMQKRLILAKNGKTYPSYLLFPVRGELVEPHSQGFQQCHSPYFSTTISSLQQA